MAEYPISDTATKTLNSIHHPKISLITLPTYPLPWSASLDSSEILLLPLSLAPSLAMHQRTKHVEIDIHFVFEKVRLGLLRVPHISADYQYADIFTKGLPRPLFERFRPSLSSSMQDDGMNLSRSSNSGASSRAVLRLEQSILYWKGSAGSKNN